MPSMRGFIDDVVLSCNDLKPVCSVLCGVCAAKKQAEWFDEHHGEKWSICSSTWCCCLGPVSLVSFRPGLLQRTLKPTQKPTRRGALVDPMHPKHKDVQLIIVKNCKHGVAEDVVCGYDFSYSERPLCHEAVDAVDVVQMIVHEALYETVLFLCPRCLSHHVSSLHISPLPPWREFWKGMRMNEMEIDRMRVRDISGQQFPAGSSVRHECPPAAAVATALHAIVPQPACRSQSFPRYYWVGG